MNTDATTTRDNAQLEILAAACRCRQDGRLIVYGRRGDSVPLELLVLGREALLVATPAASHEIANMRAGVAVDVYFEQAGERFAFASRIRGIEPSSTLPHVSGTLISLALPETIERRQQREHYRISLKKRSPIAFDLVDVEAPDVRVHVRLLDISGGGFRSTARKQELQHALDGRRFHARFTLPDEPEPLELVVRLVHYQASPLDPRNVIAGWAFCSTEDPVQQQRQEIRIERFVAREELARVRRRQPKHKES